jgi:hypothetical protein
MAGREIPKASAADAARIIAGEVPLRAERNFFACMIGSLLPRFKASRRDSR